MVRRLNICIARGCASPTEVALVCHMKAGEPSLSSIVLLVALVAHTICHVEGNTQCFHFGQTYQFGDVDEITAMSSKSAWTRKEQRNDQQSLFA
jgi:hypothetical protein